MIINLKEKTIQIKIVYYGCAMSGKTTSLKCLFRKLKKENKLTSIETTTGRTLFFDFGTFSINGGEWSIKVSLYSATGQDFYASTRPATLNGADGIIFIIDSQKVFFKDNLISWQELKYYYENRIYDIPIIFSLNKQDLTDLISIDEIKNNFHLCDFRKIDFFKTIAKNGNEILEAFKKMMNLIFPSINIR
ncbi:MAG: GTP-binding protein [Promethearchaeota archaeon]